MNLIFFAPEANMNDSLDAPVATMNNISYAEEANMNKVFGQPTDHIGPGKPIEILLVEDNPEDASLTIETLQEGRIRNHVTHLDDGVPAMEFLRHRAQFAAAPRPDLILLDLKLQKMHGREVLAEIKNDPDLRRIPVVIMTTSSAEQDIFESYNLHANCYLTKPVELDEFIGVIRKIEDFWLTIVKLPAT